MLMFPTFPSTNVLILSEVTLTIVMVFILWQIYVLFKVIWFRKKGLYKNGSCGVKAISETEYQHQIAAAKMLQILLHGCFTFLQVDL